MRVKQTTKDLAYIRRQIREAIKWHKVDDGMPYFYTTDNYKGGRRVKPVKGENVGYYPYYTKSNKAIEVIAEKIYERIKNDINDIKQESKIEVTKRDLIKGRFIRFKANNTIQYGQDFRQHIGVPHDVIFIINKVYVDRITIIGKGYGETVNYGNGALHIPFSFLKGKYIYLRRLKLS